MSDPLAKLRRDLDAEHRWDDVRERRVLTASLRAWRAGGSSPKAPPARASAWALAMIALLTSLLAVSATALYRARHEEAAAPSPSTSAATAPDSRDVPPPDRAARAKETRVLLDGSRVTYDASTRLEVVESRAERVRVRQLEGEARYEVTPIPGRAFVVQAADVEVRVRGTRFTVALEEDWVLVAVEEGHVEVDDAAGAVLQLLAGGTARVRAFASRSDAQPEPTKPPVRVARPPHEATLDALLEEANQARARGDLGRAASRLEDLLGRSPDRGRKAVALFALGRVERARGDAHAAGRAFARCATVASEPTLKEDALAEAAESMMAAGETDGARRQARDYLATYPSGSHASRMRLLAR
jgi:TolA-binding protein